MPKLPTDQELADLDEDAEVEEEEEFELALEESLAHLHANEVRVVDLTAVQLFNVIRDAVIDAILTAEPHKRPRS